VKDILQEFSEHHRLKPEYLFILIKNRNTGYEAGLHLMPRMRMRGASCSCSGASCSFSMLLLVMVVRQKCNLTVKELQYNRFDTVYL
jgi:hypothetical protein